MTIESLLTDLNSKFDVLITLLGNQDGGSAAAPAAAGATSTTAKRGRGRPAADDPKPAPAAAPVAAVPEVDPFDEPAAPIVAAKKVDKTDVRAALEAFRLRLKSANLALGDTEADAQNKATTRALAWLKEVSGTSTLASLEESKFALVVEKAQTAK